MKQEVLKTGMAICKNCGGTYNRKECIRIYGEFSAPAINGFCSASCYTQHAIKPESQPQDESQKELFTGGEWAVAMNYEQIWTNNENTICTVSNYLPEYKANAALIAASKDMYRALKESAELIKELLSFGDHHPLLDKIENILKKANPNK